MRRGPAALLTILGFLLLGTQYHRVQAETGPYTSYWIIASPEWTGSRASGFDFPTLYFYAPHGATIRFRFDDGRETGAVSVSPCEIAEFSLNNIKPPLRDWGIFYVEVISDDEFWIVGKKRYMATGGKPQGTFLPEFLVAQPQRGLSTTWHVGASWSAAVGDLVAIYAPDSTWVDFIGRRGENNFYTRRLFITPPMQVLEVSQTIYTWGFSTMEIRSEKPIAVGYVDGGGYQKPDPGADWSDGIWYNLAARKNLLSSYRMDREAPFFGAYFPTATTFRARRPSGEIIFSSSQAERSWLTVPASFPTGPMIVEADTDFSPDFSAPPASDQNLSSATFFGFDPAVSRLVLFGPSSGSASVAIAEARTPGQKVYLNLAAGESLVRRLPDLGLDLAESKPFLLRVEASAALFMAVQIDSSGGFLRPYPVATVSKCFGDGDVKVAYSNLVPCLTIKVPPEGRKKVTGNRLLVKADICHETASRHNTREAVRTVLFQYRFEGGAWKDIAAPDEDFPWQAHWDVSQFPETTVWIQAVGRDAEGKVIRPMEREIVIDHRNPEIAASKRIEIRVNLADGGEASAGDARIVIPKSLRVKHAGGQVFAQSAEDRVVMEEATPDMLPVGAAGKSYEIHFASGASEFEEPIDLHLSYPDADGDGVVDGTTIAATSLRGFYYSEIDDAWKPVETVKVDIASREVHLRTDHFTVFSLAGTAGTAPESAAKCIVTRAVMPPYYVVSFCRSARDLVMDSAVGRFATLFYYAI